VVCLFCPEALAWRDGHKFREMGISKNSKLASPISTSDPTELKFRRADTDVRKRQIAFELRADGAMAVEWKSRT
jgi:hypothetical protein